MKVYLILFSLVFVFSTNAQKRYKKPKNSLKTGTFYGYWGYNRSAYTKTNLHVVGTGFDLTLKHAKATDNPLPIGSAYINPATMTVPQFNARLGYMFKDTWGISIGSEHMKYLFADNNAIKLDGFVTPGADSVWSGTYQDQPITTHREHFHYENSNGLNYINVQLTKFKEIYRPKMRQWFRINGQFGVGTGVLLCYNDFKFANHYSVSNRTLSGMGISVQAGLRFEFGKHFFIQPDLQTGWNWQMHVRINPNDRNWYAKHNYFYGMFGTYAGFMFYIKAKKNGCDSCPQW
jgi:hypothetical protein